MIKKIESKESKKISTKEYVQTLADLKKQIQEAQIKSVLAVNKELIKLYWNIGKTIVEKQKISGWGTQVIEKLAKDLQNLFPGLGGFSRSNIFKMRSFYISYKKVSQAVRQFDELPVFNIPWGHNVVLITKLKNNEERFWYAQKTIDKGLSRNVLEMYIKSNLYKREGKVITNFKMTLPPPHSDYIEQDLEQGLIDHIQKFLLELGEGFAFVGRQYHLEIGETDFYIDLLFYHLKLRCYIVIELKNNAFKPEYAGQLNFYLSAVDDLLRNPDDKPTIGLIICKSKNDIVAEYALRDIKKPIGVSGYETELVKKLPKNLKSSLPTIEEIEAELEKEELLNKQKVKRKKRKP